MTGGLRSLTLIFLFRIILAFSSLSTKELKDWLQDAFVNTAFPWAIQGVRQTLLRLCHLQVEWTSMYNSHKNLCVLQIQFQQICTYTGFSTPTQVPIKFDEQDIPGKEKFIQKETSLAWLKPSNLAVHHCIRDFSQCLLSYNKKKQSITLCNMCHLLTLSIHVIHGCTCPFYRFILAINAWNSNCISPSGRRKNSTRIESACFLACPAILPDEVKGGKDLRRKLPAVECQITSKKQ